MSFHPKNPFLIKEKYNPLEVREEKILTLRKKKLNRISFDRLKSYEQSNASSNIKSYEINPTELNLTNNEVIKMYYTKDKLSQFQMSLQLLGNSDPFIVKFAIHGIKIFTDTLSQTEKDNIQMYIPENIFKGLLQFLIPNQDKQVLYEIAKILIVLTYTNNFYSTLIIQNAQNFYTFILSQKDPVLIKQLLWVLANVLGGSESLLNQAIKTYQFLPDYIYGIIEKEESIYHSIEIFTIVLWIYGRFYESPLLVNTLIESKCFVHLPIIAKFIRTQIYMTLFEEAVYAIHQFIKFLVEIKECRKDTENAEKYNALIKSLHLSQLVSFLKEKESRRTKEYILKIFALLGYLEDSYLIELISNGLITQLENILIEIDAQSEVKIDNFWWNYLMLIYNMATSRKSSVTYSISRNSSICQRLIKYTMTNKFSSCKEEVMNIFSGLLDNNFEKIKTELIVIYLPELCVMCLDEIDNPKQGDTVLFTLNCIAKLLEHGAKMMKNRNIVRDLLLQKNCKEKLEKIMIKSKNQEVISESNFLLKTYFTESIGQI